MIALPEHISGNDVHQWLGEGVCVGLIEDTWIPCFYRDHDSSRRLLYMQPVTLDMDQMNVELRIEQVMAHWPLCGAVNVEQDRCAMYVQRTQRRQYRRTYNSRCLDVQVLGKWALLAQGAGLTPHRDANQACVINACFSPDYPESIEQARDWLVDRASVALNAHITLVGEQDECAVYYRTRHVGYMRDGDLIQECDDLTFRSAFKLLGVG